MDELRGKLEDKNKTIEKKTGAALHATQEKNRIANELNDLRDQIDIKDRKVNVLQRKVSNEDLWPYTLERLRMKVATASIGISQRFLKLGSLFTM